MTGVGSVVGAGWTGSGSAMEAGCVTGAGGGVTTGVDSAKARIAASTRVSWRGGVSTAGANGSGSTGRGGAAVTAASLGTAWAAGSASPPTP